MASGKMISHLYCPIEVWKKSGLGCHCARHFYPLILALGQQKQQEQWPQQHMRFAVFRAGIWDSLQYSEVGASYTFTAVAIQTSEVFRHNSIKFLKELVRHLSKTTGSWSLQLFVFICLDLGVVFVCYFLPLHLSVLFL